MEDRKCEKCDATVPAPGSFCEQCGWENDLKYFVPIDKPAPKNEDQLSGETEREKWKNISGVIWKLAAALLVLELLLSVFFWGATWWWGMLPLTPYVVGIQSTMLGFYIWLTTPTRINLIEREGGGQLFAGKCIVAILIACILSCVMAAPSQYLADITVSFGLIIAIYLPPVFLVPIMLAALPYLVGIMFAFETSIMRAFLLTTLIWLTQLATLLPVLVGYVYMLDLLQYQAAA